MLRISCRSKHISKAFSLVEVIFSVAIFVFCVLGILGLLVMGINSMQSSRQTISAVYFISEVSKSILNAQSSNGEQFAASGAFSNLTWSLGGGSVHFFEENYNPSLSSMQNGADLKRLAVYIQIEPPIDSYSSGTALVSVAWPANPHAQFDSLNCRWSGVQSSESTRLMFLPFFPRTLP